MILPIHNAGIIYIATGKKYLQEAISSVQLSSKYLDDFPICIITDLVEEAKHSKVFDLVVHHPSPSYSYRDNIEPLINLPFRYNLFLDSDAFFTFSPSEIFTYGLHSHVAASFAPVRHPPGWSDDSVPRIFAELNTGVLLLKRCRKVSRLISSWLSLYDTLNSEYSQQWDQASFRSVLWEFITKNKLRFLPLPPECNLRTPKPWIAGRGQPVYIVHGRLPYIELTSLEQYLNSNIDRFRTFAEWLSLYPDSFIRPRFDNQ